MTVFFTFMSDAFGDFFAQFDEKIVYFTSDIILHILPAQSRSAIVSGEKYVPYPLQNLDDVGFARERAFAYVPCCRYPLIAIAGVFHNVRQLPP
jgi:hypothetical protein